MEVESRETSQIFLGEELFLAEGGKNPFPADIFRSAVNSEVEGMSGAEKDVERAPGTAILEDMDAGNELGGEKVEYFFSVNKALGKFFKRDRSLIYRGFGKRD